jgi:hypothetical protein
MALGRTLRILLALLLLSAQHAALSHALAHLDPQGVPAEQKQLCDQHDAFGSVAGAVGCANPPTLAAVRPLSNSFVADLPAASAPGLEPSSRGPPSLL